jgi:protein ImuA
MTALARPSSLADIHADVWHAHALATAPVRVQATGNGALDAQLPGGGWPVGGMTEVLQTDGAHCEWRLLLPALARCGQGPVVLVGAPFVPFAPALAAQGLAVQRLLWMAAQTLAQRLWAAEQALRCAEVDAVLAWLPAGRADTVRTDQLRRLQMAASGYNKLLFVMRPAAAWADASPAVLRLQVGVDSQRADALEVQLLKRRGPPCDQPLTLQACSAQLSMLLAAHGQPLVRPRDALDRPAARAA